ncbi:MAG TPA: four helix bundle protein [Vicinamibacterales bacterium]|nr:four helix bundle protein [Vicinamibacterales bacterium]
MKVERVQDLKVFQKAEEFWTAVNKVLSRPGLRGDRRLHEQLSAAIDSIVSNISEGFEQPTDRGFAKYLYDTKGSTAEARKCLWIAAERAYITRAEFTERDAIGDELARMTVGLIKYLDRYAARNENSVLVRGRAA